MGVSWQKVRAGRVRIAAAVFASVGAVIAARFRAGSHAQVVVGGYAESPSDALARNMKVLGTSPSSFDALIGAGRAALALGDTQAAAGFFGRADEVWSAKPAAAGRDGRGSGAGRRRHTARSNISRAHAARRDPVDDRLPIAGSLTISRPASQAQADYRAALFGTRRR